jgi:hypothetical protein
MNSTAQSAIRSQLSWLSPKQAFFGLAALLAGCTAEHAGDPNETRGRIIDVTRAQVGRNLYDPHVAVSTFCLYGGVYTSTPNSRNGFYDYVSVDSLGLQHSQGRSLVIHYVMEGEEEWLRVNFGMGGEEVYDFYINPDRRLASCGVEGLWSLRESFRNQGERLPAEAFPAAMSHASRNRFRHWDSSEDDIKAHSDEVICALATTRTPGRWDSVYWSAPYVEEAKARHFTPSSCQALINDPVLDRNATLDRLYAEAQQQMGAHWPNEASSGMSKEDLLRTFRINYAFRTFTTHLKRLPAATEDEAILEELGRLFAKLDAINSETGGRLLQTDERELLVPLIIALAEAAGLDPSRYPDDDPTLAFRTF